MGALEGRRIIVTGAASGQGRAIAQHFAAEGATVALFDVNEAGLAETLASTPRAQSYVCDVSDRAMVTTQVSAAVAGMGGCDGIINAAGILYMDPIDQITPEKWDRLMGVNLTGMFNIIHAALPALKAADSATIVNIASISGMFPMYGTAAYGASKGGVIMLTKGLACDLGPKIRANAICPGVIQTEQTRHIWTDPTHTDRAVQRTALKRLGTVEDIAHAALYLSTEASAYCTGNTLTVDGGLAWQ